MGTSANNEDPDEMHQNMTGSALFAQIKSHLQGLKFILIWKFYPV